MLRDFEDISLYDSAISNRKKKENNLAQQFRNATSESYYAQTPCKNWPHLITFQEKQIFCIESTQLNQFMFQITKRLQLSMFGCLLLSGMWTGLRIAPVYNGTPNSF